MEPSESCIASARLVTLYPTLFRWNPDEQSKEYQEKYTLYPTLFRWNSKTWGHCSKDEETLYIPHCSDGTMRR